MTKQIVVKFNEKRWKSVFATIDVGLEYKIPQRVKHCVWYVYWSMTQKIPELGNKTRCECCYKKIGLSHIEAKFNFLKSYNKFINSPLITKKDKLV